MKLKVAEATQLTFSLLSGVPRITSRKASTISFASCLRRLAQSHSISISSAILRIYVSVAASVVEIGVDALR